MFLRRIQTPDCLTGVECFEWYRPFFSSLVAIACILQFGLVAFNLYSAQGYKGLFELVSLSNSSLVIAAFAIYLRRSNALGTATSLMLWPVLIRLPQFCDVVFMIARCIYLLLLPFFPCSLIFKVPFILCDVITNPCPCLGCLHLHNALAVRVDLLLSTNL